MRVVITGSATWVDADAIRRELAKVPPGSTVVPGDSPGADALAGRVARELGLAVEAMRKESGDYRRFGRAAWKGLNERMLTGVELVLAFHEGLDDPRRGKGTRHMLQLAQGRGVEVRAFVR